MATPTAARTCHYSLGEQSYNDVGIAFLLIEIKLPP